MIKSPKELVIQFFTADLLLKFCRVDWRYTHIPSGEERDPRVGAKLKRMGLVPHWPDFILVPPGGVIHCLECKRIGEDLDDGQEAFKEWCIRSGIPHVTAWKQDDVIAAFNEWKCLTIEIR